MKSTKPITAAVGSSLQHLRASDIRGIAQLAIQATAGVTRITEGVHRSVLATLGIAGDTVPGRTRGITGLVYRTVHAVTQGVGFSVDKLLAALHVVFASNEGGKPETPQRAAVLAALNGVMGDRLIATNNPLASTMSFRYSNDVLNCQALPPLYAPAGKILLLIHGLCMTDLRRHAQRQGQASDHGATLATALGYTPVYLHYNSGLHISHNGRELSARLEQLLTHWPATLEELSVVAHSMGGLLIRSAVHYARQAGLRWPDRLKSIVFLGTPHHGAPLERAGNWVDTILAGTPYTQPFSALGKLRSAGITDLRYGHVLDEDWHGHDRFEPKPDARQCVPLPNGVACYTVAATTAAKRSTLANRLIGDGLVPLHSALGHHDDARRKLNFAPASQWIAYRTGHLDLLSSPEVTRQMAQWLTPE
jgi:hypothetical protein